MDKMTILNHPLNGATVAIATMHCKEKTIGPILNRWYNVNLVVADDVNTDALGTFTGEIPRFGSMLDAARQKALLAIERTGEFIGIGSEGAFGPHPLIHFLASGLEVIVLHDARLNHDVVVQRRTQTNYDSITLKPSDDASPFLDRIKFPNHAVIVRPEKTNDPSINIKGIKDIRSFNLAIKDLSALSTNNSVIVQTDMRAHMNPTRMKSIALLTKLLAIRTARLCPECNSPGFGLTDVMRGLPCETCGLPTNRIRAEIHRCTKCNYQLLKRERSINLRADTVWCNVCNP